MLPKLLHDFLTKVRKAKFKPASVNKIPSKIRKGKRRKK